MLVVVSFFDLDFGMKAWKRFTSQICGFNWSECKLLVYDWTIWWFHNYYLHAYASCTKLVVNTSAGGSCWQFKFVSLWTRFCHLVVLFQALNFVWHLVENMLSGIFIALFLTLFNHALSTPGNPVILSEYFLLSTFTSVSTHSLQLYADLHMHIKVIVVSPLPWS